MNHWLVETVITVIAIIWLTNNQHPKPYGRHSRNWGQSFSCLDHDRIGVLLTDQRGLILTLQVDVF